MMVSVKEGSWHRDDLRLQAIEEDRAAEAAETLGLTKRATAHRSKIYALWRQDQALREYADFPKKFASLGLPGNPTPMPIELHECSQYHDCRQIWLNDGLSVKVLTMELFRAPGWTHLQRVDLDSDYPAPSMPLYITVAALREIVSQDQIMVFVEQEHERRRRVSNPDPILVVKAGDGYYLIARWK